MKTQEQIKYRIRILKKMREGKNNQAKVKYNFAIGELMNVIYNDGEEIEKNKKRTN